MSNADDMMNSFDFSQSPQSPLIEPVNFIGPINATSTSIKTAVSSVGILSYGWLVGASLVAGILIVAVVFAILRKSSRTLTNFGAWNFLHG